MTLVTKPREKAESGKSNHCQIPSRLIGWTYHLGEEIKDAHADEPAPGGARQQRRDEDAAGDGQAVRPARQQPVDRREHRQRLHRVRV